MTETDIINDSLLNAKLFSHFSQHPDKYNCFMCNGEAKPLYYQMKDTMEYKVTVLVRESRPICLRCYKLTGMVDRFMTKVMRTFLWRW